MRKWLKKLRRRRQLDRDLEDELRFHLEMKAEETGDPQGARRKLGNLMLLKETCRDLWTFTVLETWWQDIRYALRTLARNRGVTAVAVVALALGIGADTAVFTFVKGALTFEPGIDHADRVVLVSGIDPLRNDDLPQPDPDLRNFRSQVKSLASLAAYRFASVNVSDQSAPPERYTCIQMSANGFAVTGRRPLLGRSFQPEDERPDAPPVIMLAYQVWQNRYGKDRAVIGRTVRVDETPRVVVGVMPAGMRFPEDTDLWIPLMPGQARGAQPLLFGRLADGVKLAAARSEMDAIARRLTRQDPAKLKGLALDVRPILEIYGVYAARPLFLAVLCAVGFVVLIACANVANLLLARAAVRSREISIRIAIGAGRLRIIRQLLVESVLLAAGGGLFGWLIALAGLRWFDASTARFPRPAWLHFSIDEEAFLYLAALSLGTGLLFGLAPALRLAKVDLHSAVKDGGHGATGGVQSRHLASLLIVFEMALCVVLLVGAGLLIRSVVKVYGTPLGVNTADVLTALVHLPEAKYKRPEEQTSFHERLATTLRALPGVEMTALASHLPGRGWMSLSWEVDGTPGGESGRLPDVGAIVVSAEYFHVMQVGARRGRLFAASAAGRGALEVIVNESFAQRFWPGEDPLGKRLRIVDPSTPRPWSTVIGVVPDIRQNMHRPIQRDPLVYLSYAANPQPLTFVVARTLVPPASLIRAFRAEVQKLDENLPLYDVRTLEDRIAQNRLSVGIFGTLFTIFGAIALVLASVGLYAVTAHAVSQRTREIGIRMAVGGTPPDIVRLVFAQGVRPVAIGLALGLPLALAVARVLRGALVGVSPGDPFTFLAVVAVLLLAGLLAVRFPPAAPPMWIRSSRCAATSALPGALLSRYQKGAAPAPPSS